MPTLFFFLSLAASALAATPLGSHATSQPPAFTNSRLKLIRANAVNASTQSWEIGTCLEARMELDTPKLSVFGANRVPADASDDLSLTSDALSTIDDVLASRSPNLKAFLSTGAPADSASIGVADIVAGITTGDAQYADAAASQLDWILHHVPRDDTDKIISHRQEKFQAWADSLSMVPPFLAYYAAASGGDNGAGLMAFAYEQVKGYRGILRDSETGLWQHVMGGDWNDPGLWLTGNGWAAHGMLRVEQTIAKSEYASAMHSKTADLRGWVNEILNATWTRQEDSGLMKNYMDQDSFEDAAGTALITAATYRYSLITQTTDYIPNAERAFSHLIKLTDSDGWLTSTVDPNNFHQQGSHSPEAQSFLLMLQAAAQDYYSWSTSPGPALANALLSSLFARD